MLTRPTVLVIGAGASAPYGFPIGIELSERIFSALRPGNQQYDCLVRDFGYGDQEISRFRDQFYYSGKNSVDAFLEYRDDLMEIGKVAIASLLIPHENNQQLFQFSRSWLRHLFATLNTGFDQFEKNQLSIITFNYDRSVEHFLFTALRHTYNRTESDCCALLEKIPVIHLHGRLGYLPWQKENGRPYAHNLDPREVRLAAENIKIIHEDVEDGRDADFKRAKELLSSAQRVIVMGFGYNKTNINRLGINKSIGCKVLGSALGLGEQEKRVAIDLTEGKLSLRDGDCYDMVREHVIWS